MKRTLSAALSLLLAASASAQAPAAALTRIGTAAAVRGAVSALSAGSAVGRVISSGKPLFLNDHVTTDAAGRLQVLLLDETIFTLGPNSDMVLDDFVYDPKTSAGRISASIAKGTFRFVTGKIAAHDPDKLKLKVAVGTIGVRGSIGVGEVNADGATIINGGARNPDNYDDASGIYAQGGGKTVNLIQPGVGTHIGVDGRVDAPRFMVGDLNRIMGTLQTQVTQNQNSGGGRPEFSHHTASDVSGRSTAVGGLLAAADLVSADLTSTLNSTLASTVQNINSGVSNWSEIIGGVGGTGNFAGNGAYSCVGGGCGSGSSGTWDFSAAVNFGSQKITSMSISDQGSAFFGASGSNIPFGTSGPAVLSLSSPLYSGSYMKGTTATFYDQNGTIAGGLTITLKGQDFSGATVSGSASATR